MKICRIFYFFFIFLNICYLIREIVLLLKSDEGKEDSMMPSIIIFAVKCSKLGIYHLSNHPKVL